MSTKREVCPGCRVELIAVEGTTDPYGGASPSCWAAFGAVLARDYSEFGYPDIHGLIVDAYMAQHPGFATPAGRRSVVVHLIGLCLALETGTSRREIVKVFRSVLPGKPDVRALLPVPGPGVVTVTSLHGARDLENHTARARVWAAAVWESWSSHQPVIRDWATQTLQRFHSPEAIRGGR